MKFGLGPLPLHKPIRGQNEVVIFSEYWLLAFLKREICARVNDVSS